MGDVAKDYNPPNLTSQTAAQYKAFLKFGPQVANLVQGISEQISPKEQALQLKLLQDYAPQFSKIGQDIATSDVEAGVARDLGIVQGKGKELAQQALLLDQIANPQFYALRETANKGFQDLIGGQDPNKLTGAEVSNIERGVNRLNARTGNLNTGDATSTVAGAMQFGDELGKKRDRFTQALSLFPGISEASRNNIDTFQVATGKTSQAPNFGQQQFQLQNGMQGIQGMQDRIAGAQQTQMQIKAGRRTPSDFVNQAYTAFGSGTSGAASGITSAAECCFIMISANEGLELPWWIRTCRDYYYSKEPQVRDGYKKMAKDIVPLMERNLLVRKLIKYSMFYPLSFYGAYTQGLNFWGKIFKPVKNFWFAIWRNY